MHVGGVARDGGGGLNVWLDGSDTGTVREASGIYTDTHAGPEKGYTVMTVCGASLAGVTRVMPAESLRTVPMPDLRSPDALTLDAEARDLRTAGDKLAELTQDMRRLSETVQMMAVPLDVAMRLDELAARVDMLAAKVDELQARPLAMAEDAWGVG